MGRMTNKTVMVTGASSGIGKSTALLFAKEGATLILGDIHEEGLRQTVEEAEENGARAIGIATDVSKFGACRNLVEQGVKATGALDVLVNAAGIAVFDKTVENTEEELWNRVLDTNLKSVYLTSKFAIPHMRARGGGVIINLSSPHAFLTDRGVAPYAASKGGVMALSRQMAFDLASDRIRVLAVIPGATDTPMLRSQALERNTTLESLGFHSDQSKLGRIATPEELAKGIVWLATDEASFVNACPFVIDGGLTARL